MPHWFSVPFRFSGIFFNACLSIPCTPVALLRHESKNLLLSSSSHPPASKAFFTDLPLFSLSFQGVERLVAEGCFTAAYPLHVVRILVSRAFDIVCQVLEPSSLVNYFCCEYFLEIPLSSTFISLGRLNSTMFCVEFVSCGLLWIFCYF